MANRVTATEVKAILDGCLLADSDVDTYITAGNALVTEVLGTTTLTAALLKEIERYLTAHLIATTRHRQTVEEKIGDVAVKYAGKWDLGLSSTTYGQHALMLDITGRLANIGKKRASLYAIKQFES
jgi:uncharacterized protein (DUF1697 family)